MEQGVNHHGKFILTIKNKSGKSWEDIASISGYARSSIYRWIKQEFLDPEKIINIAEACGVDITGYLPEVDHYRKTFFKDYEKSMDLSGDESLKAKYITALERLANTQNQLNEIQQKYYKLKEQLDNDENSQ
ncbi:MAG: helix-turn-helix transcriptional regulator [Brumimicrobium sp.]